VSTPFIDDLSTNISAKLSEFIPGWIEELKYPSEAFPGWKEGNNKLSEIVPH
jgi:hypothetical protein